MHDASGLGFFKEHQDLNIQRIGYVTSEITKNRGNAICAPIAPYAVTRRKVRELIEPVGGFFEVCVSTPIEVCEQRDRKGLYAKARAGVLKEFTGVSDPYEAPQKPELSLNAGHLNAVDEAEACCLSLDPLAFSSKSQQCTCVLHTWIAVDNRPLSRARVQMA